MSPHESPRIGLERIGAERQKLADLAFANLPPPAVGMKRLMWFGDSDTPMPVDIPEGVASRIAALSGHDGLDKGPIHGFPTLEQLKSMRKIRRLVQPYIKAQYPTEREIYHPISWWRRALRKCGVRF